MNYELAKELRDAGFPQGGKGSWIGPVDQIVWRSGDRVYVPTLEELIEVCGKDFGILGRSDKTEWFAVTRGDEHPNDPATTKVGSTPTEAVAGLWLALKA
jgi:hypothetical protein